MHSGRCLAKAQGRRWCGTTWVTRTSRDPELLRQELGKELSKEQRQIPWLPAFAIALSVQTA